MTKKPDKIPKGRRGDLARALLAQHEQQPIEKAIDKDILTAIGALIGTAGLVETSLSFHMLAIAGVDKNRIYPLVVGAEIGVKIQQIKRLAATRTSGKPLETIEECADKLRNAFGKRDAIAHAMIFEGRTKAELSVQDVRLGKNGKIPDPQYFSASDIRGFARVLALRLIDLEDALKASGIDLPAA